MRPLIKHIANVDNITTYLQLELAKIKTNCETLCFTTEKDLTANVVVQSNIKNLKNNLRLVNTNTVQIPKGTELYIPLADLPFKQTDTDLTIQYALNSTGEYVQFMCKSLFDGYVARNLTFTLLDGSIRIKSTQPKPVKLNKPARQLITVKKWYVEQQTQLNLNSIAEVDTHYQNLQWRHRHYWRKWSEINSADFAENASDAVIGNFYRVLNHYKISLKNQ